MVETLRLKLNIENKEALIDVKALKSELDKLAKSTQKAPKIDTKPYRAFREQAALASATTTQLGRRLDQLTERYGANSEQVKRFTKEQLKSNQVAKIQRDAIKDLKIALDNGAISQHKYRLEMAKIAKTQTLFINKMKGATPIRLMSSQMREIGSILSGISPMFGGAVGSVAEFTDRMMDARSQLGGTAEGLAGLGSGARVARAGFASLTPVLLTLLPVLAAVATAMAGIFLVKKGFDFTQDFIRAGQEVEKIEKNLAGLINSSTVFKNANDEAVSPMENLNASMEHAQKLFKALQVEAVKLAGLTTQDLLSAATFGIPQLASLGITDAEKQAKTLGTLTASIKQLGLANNEIQQKIEVRAFLGGDVNKQGADFAKYVAAVNGGTDAFKRNYEEAKKNGEMYEFLSKALEPFATNQTLAADSVDNNFSVIQDGLDRTYQEVGRKLTPAFKELQLQLIDVLFEDGPNGTTIFNRELEELTEQIGVELADSIRELKPLIKPTFEAMIQGAAASVKALVLLLKVFNEVVAKFEAFTIRYKAAVQEGAATRAKFGMSQAGDPGSAAAGAAFADMFSSSTKSASRAARDIIKPTSTILGSESAKILRDQHYGLKAHSKTGQGGTDDKASQKASQKAEQEAKRVERLKEQLDKAKELTQEAEKSLQTAILHSQEQQKQLKLSKDIHLQEQAINVQKEAYSEEASDINFEINKINLLKQAGKLTDSQAEAMIYQNKLRLIENKYAQDGVDIAKEKIKLQEYENRLAEIKKQASIDESAKKDEIAKVQGERDTLLEGRQEGQLTIKEQEALTKLQTALTKLNEELLKIQDKATSDIAKVQENIDTQTATIDTKTKTREKQKQQSGELLDLEHSKMLEDNAKKQRSALVEGGKAIFNSIKNAFSDGKITLEEAFGILENILSKVGDLFKGDGKGGGLLSGLGSLGGLFGGGKSKSSDYDPSSLTRGADGVFTAFNNLTGVTESLNTSCGKAAKSAVGLGDGLGGLGGMLSGLFSGGGMSAMGGFGGMANMAIGGITTALSIGQSVFSAFSSRKKKKKEEYERQQVEKIKSSMERIFRMVDQMEKDLENRLQDFQRRLNDINREIRKIDVGSSLFLGQQVIDKTMQQISQTIDEIGEGSELIIKTFEMTWSHQGMSGTLISTIQNLGDEATGLYAERNRQIQYLNREFNNLYYSMIGPASTSGTIEQALIEARLEHAQKVIEINEEFNDRIYEMTEQRKDLQEALEKAIEQQKTNFVDYMKRVEKAKAEVQFGEGAGSLYDEMIDTVAQIREVMMSGIDPQQATFLIERLKEKATNNLKNQYRDFIEGTNDSYLASISAIQDDLFSVISEGRVTGQIKRTQGDRLAEIQSRIERLRGESVQDSTLSLEQFGLTAYEATDALEAMIDMLNQKTLEATQQLQMGQYREIDAININTVFDPAVLAAQIQEQINRQLSTPALTTVPLV